MAERIGIRELRDNLTTMIRRVRAGEAFEITHHGVPVALLSPTPSDRVSSLIARGDVSPGKPLTRPLRRFPATGALSASQAIEDDRNGR
jgi:prevent-host-death family protein